MAEPARFYVLPDGSQSSVQMSVGPDGAPRPLEVKSPQQVQDWEAIQAAQPPSPTQLDASLMRSMARPLVADDPAVAERLAERRAEAAAQYATAPSLPEPATQAEFLRRANAAAALAATLGYQLVHVPVPDALGMPPHLELRVAGSGLPLELGGLVSLEKSLAGKQRERAERDATLAVWDDYQAELRAETARLKSAHPLSKIAVLEAEREADRERIARLEAALAAQTGQG